MTARSLKLDHLVVAARTLDEGTAYLADTLGAQPAGGGAHPLMRTHNRLFGLWGGLYLEVIAADPDAPVPPDAPRARLFSLDEPALQARLEAGPALIHWVASVAPPRQLELWQQQYPQRIPPVVPMRRGDWTWRLSVPDDGTLPALPGAHDEAQADGRGLGVVPSLIQWDTARHPADTLPHGDIALTSLAATHAQPEALVAHLDWLGAAGLVTVSAGATATLVATFDTPKGVRTLR
ncbi:MAG: hypothetical protein GAK40_00652 [Burkholderia plantarii]|nr:MAG: hypothetical protein GAK40_00652 [Burkholderia plantarii]